MISFSFWNKTKKECFKSILLLDMSVSFKIDSKFSLACQCVNLFAPAYFHKEAHMISFLFVTDWKDKGKITVFNNSLDRSILLMLVTHSLTIFSNGPSCAFENSIEWKCCLSRRNCFTSPISGRIQLCLTEKDCSINLRSCQILSVTSDHEHKK